MKKHILFMIALFFLFIGIANAEKCTVISGTGSNIGDEIACGTEHFYVLDNDGSNIKMLAKYNLYVGADFSKISVDSNTYVYEECIDSTCEGLRSNYIFYLEGEEITINSYWGIIDMLEDKYNLENSLYYIMFNENITNRTLILFIPNYGEKKTIDGKTYIKETIKIYPYTVIKPTTEGYALQNELARGVTGEKGNANYPIYATLPLFIGDFGRGGFNEFDGWGRSTENYDNFENGYINFDLNDNSNISMYLDDYLDNLEEMGYEISDIDMLNIKDLDELVKEISGNNLPLANWYNATLGNSLDYNDYNELGDLTGYLSNDYSWLWSTTYWTKTAMGNLQDEYYAYMYYFVSSAGNICYSEGECDTGIPRAGIRPVVTLSISNIDYAIETKTDGNGTVTAEKVTAAGGEVIKFTVTPKEGYVLGEVKVTDALGNVITFTDYTFTMPNANVLIEATFVPKNPNTKVFLTIIPIIVFIVSAIVYFKSKTKVYNV